MAVTGAPMEVNHLRYFFEVARGGSFTAGAARLRVSQPAVSKLVRVLENSVGGPLFERSRKGISLTALGRAYYERCERIFGAVEELRDLARGHQQECRGTLS